MLNMVFKNGRNTMIFAAICLLAGILVFVFFDELKHSHSFNRKLLLNWCIENLGRYGFSGFFVGGGLIIGARGFFQYKSDQKEKTPL
jgi:hypothetical protein